MNAVTRDEIMKNLNLRVGFYGEDGVEKIVRDVQDDAVVFAGQGKNQNLVHIISGASKAANQPNAACGVWVSNKKRAPLATEKVCSKCTRGGTSFSRTNQPRECLACGKMFADNATRDNTEQTCGTCYEIAGFENAHQDGHHSADEDGSQAECPMCQDEAAAAASVQEEIVKEKLRVEAEQQAIAHDTGDHYGPNADLECVACQRDAEQIETAEAEQEERYQAQRVELLVGEHDTEHQTIVSSDCPKCQEQLAGAPEEAEYPALVDPMVRVKAAMLRHQQGRVTSRIEDIVARLRRLADEVELGGAQMMEREYNETYSRMDAATSIVNSITWAIPNMSVHDLLREVSLLQDYERTTREA